MRLWSIHPRYLDAKGLVALWREGLLAQKVLQGKTRGYRSHPQLVRFNNTENPVGAVASYLRYVAGEADNRGYNFNRKKLASEKIKGKIPVTRGQLDYEFKHLLSKLQERSPEVYIRLKKTEIIEHHPVFSMVKGGVEAWEVTRKGRVL